MNNQIYLPAEDSFFMSECLSQIIPDLIKKNNNLKFLEIGSGSGINLETASNLGIKKQNIFSSDINTKAVSRCRSLGFHCIKSDLFSRIPENKFNIIIFNPPYLPEEDFEPEDSRISTTGGKKGNEIIIKFLRQAKNYLDNFGVILIITSSYSENITFKKLGYNSEKLSTKNLFFEKLFLWKLIPKKLQ